jgi:hypothetical protein
MQTHIEKLMELIDDASMHLPSSTYMEMCSTIKKAYDALPKNQQTYQTADTIIPIPPPGAVIPQPDLLTFVPVPPLGAVIPQRLPPRRAAYIGVANWTATKTMLKSGSWKGDIILWDNRYCKVLRKCANYITIAPATMMPPNDFTFNIQQTIKVFCNETTQFTIAFKRNIS